MLDCTAFTICARSGLAQALTLMASLKRHHKELALHVVLCDRYEGPELERPIADVSIVAPEQIDIPDLDGMRSRYGVEELSAAIKPFSFSHFFERTPDRPVLYFDPDMWVVSPLDEVAVLVGRGVSCILTPYLLEPAEFAEFSERRLLQLGAYNAGFLMLRDGADVRRTVSWWGRRLEVECFNDVSGGLFFDQRWVGLFPAFVQRTRVLRHAGYNVAYWNLSQRKISRQGDEWMSNGSPLRLMHFSGLDLEGDSQFSKFSTQFTIESLGDARSLVEAYRHEVRKAALNLIQG